MKRTHVIGIFYLRESMGTDSLKAHTCTYFPSLILSTSIRDIVLWYSLDNVYNKDRIKYLLSCLLSSERFLFLATYRTAALVKL